MIFEVRDLERESAGTEGVRKEIEFLRLLTPEKRIAMSFRLRRVVVELSRAGIRSQHPQWSADEVERELQRRILPANLFERLFKP